MPDAALSLTVHLKETGFRYLVRAMRVHLAPTGNQALLKRATLYQNDVLLSATVAVDEGQGLCCKSATTFLTDGPAAVAC